MEELVPPNKRTDNPLANERRGIDVSPEKVHKPLSKHMREGQPRRPPERPGPNHGLGGQNGRTVAGASEDVETPEPHTLLAGRAWCMAQPLRKTGGRGSKRRTESSHDPAGPPLDLHRGDRKHRAAHGSRATTAAASFTVAGKLGCPATYETKSVLPLQRDTSQPRQRKEVLMQAAT